MARSNKLMPYSSCLYIFLASICYFILRRLFFFFFFPCSVIDSWIEICAFWNCVSLKCHLDRDNGMQPQRKKNAYRAVETQALTSSMY